MTKLEANTDERLFEGSLKLDKGLYKQIDKITTGLATRDS